LFSRQKSVDGACCLLDLSVMLADDRGHMST